MGGGRRQRRASHILRVLGRVKKAQRTISFVLLYDGESSVRRHPSIAARLLVGLRFVGSSDEMSPLPLLLRREVARDPCFRRDSGIGEARQLHCFCPPRPARIRKELAILLPRPCRPASESISLSRFMFLAKVVSLSHCCPISK